jgi:hypothetical protein
MQDLNGAIGGASRSSIGSKKKAPRTLDFVVSDDLESTAPIVACAWLGGQVRLLVGLCVPVRRVVCCFWLSPPPHPHSSLHLPLSSRSRPFRFQSSRVDPGVHDVRL